MPHAFITGATGFVGGELARQLCAAGWRVTASRRPTSNTRSLSAQDIEWVTVNLHDPDEVLAALPEDLDCLFHVAANITFWPREYDAQFKDNVLATRHLVRASLQRRTKRFVFTSSAAAFGRHPTTLHEALPSRGPESPSNYERTKYQSELEVLQGVEHGLSAVILNVAAVLGPRDPNFTFIYEMVARDRGQAIMPVETSFADVREVARAHMAAHTRGRSGQRYLLGGDNTSQLELAQLIAHYAGARRPTRTLPQGALIATGGVMEKLAALTNARPKLTRELVRTMGHRWYCCSHKAVRELGYDPPPLAVIVQDTLEWMYEQGMLKPRAGARRKASNPAPVDRAGQPPHTGVSPTRDLAALP